MKPLIFLLILVLLTSSAAAQTPTPAPDFNQPMPACTRSQVISTLALIRDSGTLDSFLTVGRELGAMQTLDDAGGLLEELYTLRVNWSYAVPSLPWCTIASALYGSMTQYIGDTTAMIATVRMAGILDTATLTARVQEYSAVIVGVRAQLDAIFTQMSAIVQ